MPLECRERRVKSKLGTISFFILGDFPKSSALSLGLVLFGCSCQPGVPILTLRELSKTPGDLRQLFFSFPNGILGKGPAWQSMKALCFH